MGEEVVPSFYSSKEFSGDWCSFVFTCLLQFTREAIWAWVLLCEISDSYFSVSMDSPCVRIL